MSKYQLTYLPWPIPNNLTPSNDHFLVSTSTLNLSDFNDSSKFQVFCKSAQCKIQVFDIQFNAESIFLSNPCGIYNQRNIYHINYSQ